MRVQVFAVSVGAVTVSGVGWVPVLVAVGDFAVGAERAGRRHYRSLSYPLMRVVLSLPYIPVSLPTKDNYQLPVLPYAVFWGCVPQIM